MSFGKKLVKNIKTGINKKVKAYEEERQIYSEAYRKAKLSEIKNKAKQKARYDVRTPFSDKIGRAFEDPFASPSKKKSSGGDIFGNAGMDLAFGGSMPKKKKQKKRTKTVVIKF